MRALLVSTGVLGLILATSCREAPEGGVTVYNAPPAASITAPVDESLFAEESPITFVGVVSDDLGPENLLVTWGSDIDGILSESDGVDASGQIEFVTASLSVGNHVITLTAVDGEAESASASVVIGVQDLPDNPLIAIVHPAGGESGLEDEEFEFVVRVSDAQDPADELVVDLESDRDGFVCSTRADAVGIAVCSEELRPGTHTLTFTVTDLDDYSATANTLFVVVPRTAVDDDGDGFTEEQGDCDDRDGRVYPSATEVFNGRDDDCDDTVDEGTTAFDDDNDGQSELEGDCDDGDADIFEDAPEIVDGKDNDCDDVIDNGTNIFDDDDDGWSESQGDCDDDDKYTFPGATESLNGRDENCNGKIDDGTVAYDDDGDGKSELAGDCNDNDATIAPGKNEIVNSKDDDCDGQIDEGTNASDDDLDGKSEAQGDCNDADPAIYGGATEIKDGKDNDCDGKVDEGTTAFDDDGDGKTEEQGDCNDNDARVYPGATEITDGVDNDCDTLIDEGGAAFDDDGDGYTEGQGDCNDDDRNIKPGATEICDDGRDSDCDGAQNEENASGCETYYQDADNDGYGKPTTGKCFCSGGSGQWDVKNQSDCYDGNAAANPGIAPSAYFADNRGDGSWDYDCNGTQTPRWSERYRCVVTAGNCLASPTGFNAAPPACGQTGTWIHDCHFDLDWSPSCEPGPGDGEQANESRRQQCR